MRAREDVLAVIPRARTVEVRVSRCTLSGGAEVVDLRVFAAKAGGAPCPTLKGISLRIAEIPAVIEALSKVKTE